MFKGSGAWQFADKSHSVKLEVTPEKLESGKITVSMQNDGHVGVDVKGAGKGDIVSLEGGATLSAGTTTATQVTYEIPVRVWSDKVEVKQG